MVGQRRAVRGLDPGEAYRVGAASEDFFQVAGVLHEGKNLEAIIGEPKKHPKSHIVYSAFHGSVEYGKSIRVIRLWRARGMVLLVEDRVVGLLRNRHRCLFFLP